MADDVLHRLTVHIAPAVHQLFTAAVTVARADCADANLLRALHVKSAVAHHPRFARILRQRLPNQQFFVRTVPILWAYDFRDVAVQPEMLDNPLRGALRLARRDTDVPAVAVQHSQQTADARIHPVLKQPDGFVALAIGAHRLIRHFFAHAHVFHERPAQRRTDKFAQRRRIRHGKAELLRRIAYAVPNAFLRAGQRTVQIKITHLRTANRLLLRRSAPASRLPAIA